MCGRYVAATPVAKLAEQFLVEDVRIEEHAPSFNVAPTDEVMAVAVGREGTRQLGSFRWGLVPSWAKDPTIGNRMINLRAETVSGKPSFTRMLARSRCILPADGFYEWKDMGKGRKKQPFFVRRRDGAPIAMAGLWAVWKPRGEEDAEWLRTCSIITTTPNALMKPIHGRMPVVLPSESWDLWLDGQNQDTDDLTRLLAPAADQVLEACPVSTEVNNVANDGDQLIAPLDGHELAV